MQQYSADFRLMLEKQKNNDAVTMHVPDIKGKLHPRHTLATLDPLLKVFYSVI